MFNYLGIIFISVWKVWISVQLYSRIIRLNYHTIELSHVFPQISLKNVWSRNHKIVEYDWPKTTQFGNREEITSPRRLRDKAFNPPQCFKRTRYNNNDLNCNRYSLHFSIIDENYFSSINREQIDLFNYLFFFFWSHNK